MVNKVDCQMSASHLCFFLGWLDVEAQLLPEIFFHRHLNLKCLWKFRKRASELRLRARYTLRGSICARTEWWNGKYARKILREDSTAIESDAPCLRWGAHDHCDAQRCEMRVQHGQHHLQGHPGSVRPSWTRNCFVWTDFLDCWNYWCHWSWETPLGQRHRA